MEVSFEQSRGDHIGERARTHHADDHREGDRLAEEVDPPRVEALDGR